MLIHKQMCLCHPLQASVSSRSSFFGTVQVTPQAGSTPIKQGGDGGAEVQKLRKDLDRLQNEHAKLQVSMKFKAAEVEKVGACIAWICLCKTLSG